MNNLKKSIFSLLFVFALFCIPEQNAYSLILHSSDWQYTLDLPEDFQMTDKKGSSQYLFKSAISPVELLICCYKKNKFGNTKAALSYTVESLYGNADYFSYQWRNRECTIAQIELNLTQNQKNVGWAICAELPKQNGYVIMLGFAPETQNESQATFYENMILSSLDSLSTDNGSLFCSGAATTFIFPSEGDQDITLEVNGKTIEAQLDKSDAEANQYVIEREFAILTVANLNGLGMEACKRFYRMVYKDAGKRLQRVSFAVQNALTFGENPIKDRKELAQTLLSWTQTFTYERDLLGSDFTSLPALIQGKGGDCDSRVLLLCVMMRHMNYDTAFFVSSEYSHALLGVNIDSKGAKIRTNGKNYLLGETTAKVNLGLISEEMNNPLKWTAVTFSY